MSRAAAAARIDRRLTRLAGVTGSPANRRTPMLFCHGTQDPLVPVAGGRAAFDAHASPDRDAQWREFPIAHEVSDPEIAAVRDWLHVRLR